MFRNMESILNTFVWGSSKHKLSWQTLKRPVTLGGSALPDLALYYKASQLSHIYYLNGHDKLCYSTLVCLAATDVVAHPFHILFCKHRSLSCLGDRRHMLSHHSKIWQLAQTITGAPPLHAHAPLWDNPRLSELMTIPDHKIWIARGIIYLSQLIDDGALKPFQALKEEFDLPNCMLF